MRTYARTDVGRRREHNEDAVLREPLDAIDGYLLAVADGMGGHRAGDVASRAATVELTEVASHALAEGRTDRRAILADGFEAANREIRRLADEDQGYSGMGTTLVAAIVRDGEAIVGNVGDSRAYLVGDGIERITVDHSLVRELVDDGTITEADARTHPQRNVITQSVGTREGVTPDFFRVPLGRDTLVLCSDGLTEEVEDDEILAVVTAAPTLDAAGDRLIERANENGGSDNVSVVLGSLDDE